MLANVRALWIVNTIAAQICFGFVYAAMSKQIYAENFIRFSRARKPKIFHKSILPIDVCAESYIFRTETNRQLELV